MSTERETERIVRSWLEVGATALPDRVLDAVLDQLPATPQRRAWWPAWRFRDMNAFAKYAIAATAVVVVAIVGIDLLPTSSPNVGVPVASPTLAPTPRPSASAGAAAQPAVLGDILFTSRRSGSNDDGGNDRVYAMSPDGSNQRLLSIDGYQGYQPALSPDGTRIAFSSTRAGGFDLFLMNADGSNVARVPGNAGNAGGARFKPNWSPDGRTLLFDDPGLLDIAVAPIDGTTRTSLTANNDENPSWSFDGKRVAFDSQRDGNYEIYVMNADGSGQTRLTKNAANDNLPAWSPDGTKIAFNSDRAGTQDIYVMNADGTNVKQVTSDPNWDLWPAWSPDGKMIAFTRQVTENTGDIWVMNASGTNPVNLTNSPADDWGPTWR